MLKLSNLTIGYAQHALGAKTESPAVSFENTNLSQWASGIFSQNISFTVAAGEICVLRGPSGSGKSTLLSTLAGFLPALHGSAVWEDIDLLSLTPWDRPLTLLFQDGNLFEGLTLFENIALGVRPSGKLSQSENDEIHNILTIFEIAELADRLPEQLSGGQQQRGALARAMIRKKPLLLLIGYLCNKYDVTAS